MSQLGNKAVEAKKSYLAEHRARQLRNDFGSVLETAPGRRLLWHVLEVCGVDDDIPAGNSDAFRKLGRRSVGIQLRDAIKASHFDLWQQMEAEERKRAHSEQLQLQAATAANPERTE